MLARSSLLCMGTIFQVELLVTVKLPHPQTALSESLTSEKVNDFLLCLDLQALDGLFSSNITKCLCLFFFYIGML